MNTLQNVKYEIELTEKEQQVLTAVTACNCRDPESYLRAAVISTLQKDVDMLFFVNDPRRRAMLEKLGLEALI